MPPDRRALRKLPAGARARAHGIHLVYPTPSQGTGEKEGDDEPDIGKILEEKRQDIFAVPVFPKKTSIRVARARAVIRRASSKPFGSPYNVFIIVDAHAMREEAQNALLKLVEEPPAHCVLILITPNPDTLLNTIRSRCQRVRFRLSRTTSWRDARRVLRRIGENARIAASLSRGDIRRAREIAADFDAKGDSGSSIFSPVFDRARIMGRRTGTPHRATHEPGNRRPFSRRARRGVPGCHVG